MMTRKIAALMFPLILFVSCVTREPNPTAEQWDSSSQIVQSFVSQVSALAGAFPELAGFTNRDPDTQTQLEVRFSQGVGEIKTMRGVRTQDLKPKGIELHFLVLQKNNPVWADGSIIPLDALGMELFSGYVLSEDATPGLNEKLASIFSKHRQLFLELNKDSARNAVALSK
ncbi:hypothetical protein P0Y35_15570 [Kiritimatiellaeota bacterium B1221]|nr:hypothetical protein [Kiritimatiellaeota bacterium B1221]